MQVCAQTYLAAHGACAESICAGMGIDMCADMCIDAGIHMCITADVSVFAVASVRLRPCMGIILEPADMGRLLAILEGDVGGAERICGIKLLLTAW